MADETTPDEVRCRFRCKEVAAHPPYEADFAYSEERYAEPRTIELSAVQAQDPESEDHPFWRATPDGHMTLSVENPVAGRFFEPGAKYEIAIRRVDEED